MAVTSQAAGSAILPGFFSGSQSRMLDLGPDRLLAMVPHQLAGHGRGDAATDQLRLQRRRPGGGEPGRGVRRERLDLEHGRPAAAGERPVLGAGLRAGRVEHDPIGAAVAVDRRPGSRSRRGSRISGAGRASSSIWLPDALPVVLPGLRGIGAEFGIRQLGPRPVVLQGRIHPVAEQFVEPLRGGGQALEVVVIEGTGHRPVDDLHVNIVEYDIDGIGLAAVGQFLAGEDDAVAGEIRLQRSLRCRRPADIGSSP